MVDKQKSGVVYKVVRMSEGTGVLTSAVVFTNPQVSKKYFKDVEVSSPESPMLAFKTVAAALAWVIDFSQRFSRAFGYPDTQRFQIWECDARGVSDAPSEMVTPGYIVTVSADECAALWEMMCAGKSLAFVPHGTQSPPTDTVLCDHITLRRRMHTVMYGNLKKE